MDKKTDIFVAVGDSFTWGQGLQYYDWIKNSKMSKDEIKYFLLSDLQVSLYQWLNLHHKITNRDFEQLIGILISRKLNQNPVLR